MNILTRPTLLERLRDPQDQEAWREFDGNYRELILIYARNRGLQPQDAEDVCQLVLIALVKGLPGFAYDRERGRFRSYLGRVVAGAIQRHVQRPSCTRPAPDSTLLENLIASAATVDADWEREWMLHHFRLAMRSLRATFEPQSVVVFEHLRAGGEVSDTARRFGMSIGAVQKIKQRVGARLAELIRAQIAREEASRG
jgi:RNA polymerase sigma factor (sigma-70 family)